MKPITTPGALAEELLEPHHHSYLACFLARTDVQAVLREMRDGTADRDNAFNANLARIAAERCRNEKGSCWCGCHISYTMKNTAGGESRLTQDKPPSPAASPVDGRIPLPVQADDPADHPEQNAQPSREVWRLLEPDKDRRKIGDEILSFYDRVWFPVATGDFPVMRDQVIRRRMTIPDVAALEMEIKSYKNRIAELEEKLADPHNFATWREAAMKAEARIKELETELNEHKLPSGYEIAEEWKAKAQHRLSRIKELEAKLAERPDYASAAMWREKNIAIETEVYELRAKLAAVRKALE